MVCAIIAIAIAMLVSCYTYIGRDEYHALTETLRDYKNNLTEKNTVLTQQEKRIHNLETALTLALKEKEEIMTKLYNEQIQRIIDIQTNCFKDCEEAKSELAQLQGKAEESRKNSMETLETQTKKITQKEEKIDSLLEKIESLSGQLQGCKNEKEKWYEKYVECSDKLSKKWF